METEAASTLQSGVCVGRACRVISGLDRQSEHLERADKEELQRGLQEAPAVF